MAGHPAESTLAATELRDGLEEIIWAEIWPECRREEKLRIRALPEEEIAYAVLSRSSDDEIRIGEVPGKQVLLDGLFVDRCRWDSARQKALDSGQEFLTTAIVECKRQNKAVVGPSSIDRSANRGLHLRVQPFEATDVTQLRPLSI